MSVESEAGGAGDADPLRLAGRLSPSRTRFGESFLPRQLPAPSAVYYFVVCKKWMLNEQDGRNGIRASLQRCHGPLIHFFINLPSLRREPAFSPDPLDRVFPVRPASPLLRLRFTTCRLDLTSCLLPWSSGRG